MTPTLILSCAGAVVTAAARAIAASVVVLANGFMSVLRHANGAGGRSPDYSMFRSCPTTCGVMDLAKSAPERWRVRPAEVRFIPGLPVGLGVRSPSAGE